MKNLIIKAKYDFPQSVTACDFLSAKSGLSKSRVKDAMRKGAVWLRRRRGAMKRLRRASTLLAAGDLIELHYDERLLSVVPPEARCISDRIGYSAWYKPAGLMSQGTMYGDHCSLLRQAELFFSGREVFPVHRLDREASGVMLIAHTRDAAAKLSELFRKNLVIKLYRAEVLGELKRKYGMIDFPLDGKHALTEFTVVSHDPDSNSSVVNVSIKTGRLHQIRRHFEMIGHPVMGDPRYGKGNKNREGMKLAAVSLRFRCPLLVSDVEYSML